MRLKDVPKAPAYVCFFATSGMEVWPCPTLELAARVAKFRQERLDSMGLDESGGYRAVEKLPRVRLYTLHAALDAADFGPEGQYLGGKKA